MNTRIYLIGIMILAGVISAWVFTRLSPPVGAAVQASASAPDHAHGGESGLPHNEGHDRNHDETGEEDDHADHDEHADHATGDPSAHAGHDHGDHGDHGDICPEHRVPEEEDALCRGEHIGELQPGQGLMVRLASMDAAASAGIRLTRPQPIAFADGAAVPGRVEFNRNRLAHITPLATGVIRQVHVQPGARVGKGEVLAEVDMPEMASLSAQLLGARAREAQTEAAYLREKDLLARGISSRHEFQLAESDYRTAQSVSAQYRQQLLNFGLSQSDVRQLLLTGNSGARVSLRAPFAGTVVEMHAALGEAVGSDEPLFTVADLDFIWIELSLPESRIYQAQLDAPIHAGFDGLPGMAFTGRIFQVGAAIDERTRTLKALAEVKNPGHRLKSGMFGKVRFLEGSERQVLAVPADSLQSIGGLSFVFVQQEPDLFELRRVQAGAKTDEGVSILAGLSPDEQVVSSQGFALKSEVLKARLGASCADH